MQTQTFNIALPKALVQQIDKFAAKEYKSRSEYIREAVRIYMKDVTDWDEIRSIGRKIGKKMGIKNEKQVNDIVYEFRHGRKP